MPDQPAKITLAIAPGCPHCPGVMQALGEMVKQGEIASLQITNIASDPEFAERHAIRSVPWIRIGHIILTGAHSQNEIKQWLHKANSAEGIREYIDSTLTDGDLAAVTEMLRHSPEAIEAVIPLIESDETNINVRLGIGAILEELAGQDILQALQPGLVQLLGHARPRVRGDAAHFLALLQDKSAIGALEKLVSDPDGDVREIASESIEYLQAHE